MTTVTTRSGPAGSTASTPKLRRALGVPWLIAYGLTSMSVLSLVAVVNAPDLSLRNVLGPFVVASAIVAFAFLGFDGVSTLVEETRNPTRDVPRGIVLSTLCAGLGYTVVTVAGSAFDESVA